MVHRGKLLAKRVLGVIGGSGLYDPEGFENAREVAVETPFGAPSDVLWVGETPDATLVFLARHGRGHRLLPHEINYRANIYALKSLGVEWLVSVSAVGSMRDDIRPGDVVIVDQFIDRTSGRAATFFGDGVVAHVSMADPVSALLSELLHSAAVASIEAGGKSERVHRGGTYVVIDGPQFSTRAESRLYRTWGADVIGMTNMPEAKLAREAEMSYATLALCSDYDCWRQGEADVSVAAVLEILRQNAALAREILRDLSPRLPETHTDPAASALRDAPFG